MCDVCVCVKHLKRCKTSNCRRLSVCVCVCVCVFSFSALCACTQMGPPCDIVTLHSAVDVSRV